MNVRINFVPRSDLDLIALYVHPDFDMCRQMKRAVIAYVRGDESFLISLPNRPLPSPVQIKNYQTSFSLSPKTDEDVIRFLSQVRYKYRGLAVKLIFRMYMERAYLDACFDEVMYPLLKEGSNADIPEYQIPLDKKKDAVNIRSSAKGRSQNMKNEKRSDLSIQAPINKTKLVSSELEKPDSPVKRDFSGENILKEAKDPELQKEDGSTTDNDDFDFDAAFAKLMS